MGLIFRKKKNGFSLVEILATTIIGTMLVLVISGMFIDAYKMRDDVKETADLAREATIAMNHMTRVLRFAKVSSPITVAGTQISAKIEEGHLDFITATGGTDVTYSIDANNDLLYTQGAANPIVIAHHVNSFAGSLWDGTNNNNTLTIIFTVSDPQKPAVPNVPFRTMIKVLGA